MNVTFDLSIVQNCVLKIKDTTQEYNEYLEEDNNYYVRLGRYKYSDTFTINVIKYQSTTSLDILDTIITPHKLNDELMHLDEAYFTLPKDGHYVIDHIILPGLDWFVSQKQLQNNVLDDYQHLYLTDGLEFYKYKNGELQKCSIIEILEINPEGTSISKSSQNTFSICHLHNCYLESCKNQFTKLMKQACHRKEEVLNTEIDLVWLVLNAIKYNIEFGYLENAQSILEDITRCSNLCNKPKNTNKYGCQCG